MTAVLAPGARRGVLRSIGFFIAVASVIVPALPFGPLVAQPPLPVAVLWAAYGWADDDDGTWRRPALLFALGLLHDQLAGGPFGLYPVLYLLAFLFGRVASKLMGSPNLLSQWGGFVAATGAVCVAAWIIAPLAFGRHASAIAFVQACAVTALLFPLVRSFYMNDSLALRAASRISRPR
ncbi:MAG: hypothetical protein AB7J28_05060 [Hyphomonadaceae bacterium]